MSELPERVRKAIAEQGLLRDKQSLLVAVSGGLDSMVLLQVLHQLSLNARWRLTVAHLNHRLRGRSSDADERLVIRTARKLGLPVISESDDVAEVAHREKVSIEMAARQVRHRFLARTAKLLKIGTVALAHHADDQVELFFIRLLRGSGTEALGGMRWRRPSPMDPHIELIRPMLKEAKSALREYATTTRLRFREDASNRSLDVQRNRIRHELIPLLRGSYQPALETVIARVMDVVGAEADLANTLASGWLSGALKLRFEDLHPALQRRCLHAQLADLGIASEFELIENLRAKAEQVFTVRPGLSVFRDTGGLVRTREAKTIQPSPDFLELELSGGAGEAEFGGVKLSWRLRRRARVAQVKRASRLEIFDADRVGKRIVLRHWRPGDRFQPIGMTRSVKLQDVFTNQKIPREQRHRLVLAVSERGEIFWVQNLRISEQFKVTAETRNGLHWMWKLL